MPLDFSASFPNLSILISRRRSSPSTKSYVKTRLVLRMEAISENEICSQADFYPWKFARCSIVSAVGKTTASVLALEAGLPGMRVANASLYCYPLVLKRMNSRPVRGN